MNYLFVYAHHDHFLSRPPSFFIYNNMQTLLLDKLSISYYTFNSSSDGANISPAVNNVYQEKKRNQKFNTL